MRIVPNRSVEYEKHYQRASRIDYIGIACKEVWQSLYLHYGEPDLIPRLKVDGCRKQRLEYLANTPLFKGLKSGLDVKIGMANPFSAFARIRAQEENNCELFHDILNGVELCELMAADLEAAGPEYTIKGKLKVELYDKLPSVSVFRADHKNGVDSEALVGYLLLPNRGSGTPGILVGSSGEDSILFQAATEHVVELMHGACTVMTWDHKGAKFRRACWDATPYDVFLCYNSDDREEVKKIATELRKRGKIPWLDQWSLGPGSTWRQDVGSALGRVPCVAVFAGQAGMGPWQTMEIGLCLSRCAKRKIGIIPVVLDGVKGEPEFAMPLNDFMYLDFRRHACREEAITKLVEAIERYSGR